MLATIIESARISFVEGILIIIGILWVGGFLKSKIYVPVIIKEKDEDKNKKDTETSSVVSEEKMIYRTKERPDESYTEYEEIK